MKFLTKQSLIKVFSNEYVILDYAGQAVWSNLYVFFVFFFKVSIYFKMQLDYETSPGFHLYCGE